MRSAASCCQPLQEICVPRGARNGPLDNPAPGTVPDALRDSVELMNLPLRRSYYPTPFPFAPAPSPSPLLFCSAGLSPGLWGSRRLAFTPTTLVGVGKPGIFL